MLNIFLIMNSTLENPINNNNFKDQDEEIKAVEEEIKAEIP
jgi:hypothetical protein